ncbi:MAG: hypothetical protein HN348_02385 [Proteobacteria bacterium]|jgi:hypothetical protein|nr:hypothetical protein [Pseudomonadota bacterium]
MRALSTAIIHTVLCDEPLQPLLLGWPEPQHPKLAKVTNAEEAKSRSKASIAVFESMARYFFNAHELTPEYWSSVESDELALADDDEQVLLSELGEPDDSPDVARRLAAGIASIAIGNRLFEYGEALTNHFSDLELKAVAAIALGIEGQLEGSDHDESRRQAMRFRSALLPLLAARDLGDEALVAEFTEAGGRVLARFLELVEESHVDAEEQEISAAGEHDVRWIRASRALSIAFLVNSQELSPNLKNTDPLAPELWTELAQFCEDNAHQLVGPCEWMARVVADGSAKDLCGPAEAMHSEAQDSWQHWQDGSDWSHEEGHRLDWDASLAESWERAAASSNKAAPPQKMMAQIAKAIAPELSAAKVGIDIDPDDDDGCMLLDEMVKIVNAEQALWAMVDIAAARRVGLARHIFGLFGVELWGGSSKVSPDTLRLAAGALVLLEIDWPLWSTPG